MIEQVIAYGNTERFRQGMGISLEDELQFSLLAQGEYNANYVFQHPKDGKSYLLRVNAGSQMHLEKQITYEADALKAIEGSGRTPKIFYVDDAKDLIPNGVSVMEFLPGVSLDYHKDLGVAAKILADIHSTKIEHTGGLIASGNPCREILEECNAMFSVYEKSDLADVEKRKVIRRLLDLAEEKVKELPDYDGYKCCINTELNSTNFLITDKEEECYLIDWEKPLLGDPAQDLGHFLAPTTTFWKTDVIFSQETVEGFITDYMNAVDGRYDLDGLRERTLLYIPVTCMRGITWCAMAWVEYQEPGRALRNESTWNKLNDYLAWDFIHMIEERIEAL